MMLLLPMLFPVAQCNAFRFYFLYVAEDTVYWARTQIEKFTNGERKNTYETKEDVTLTDCELGIEEIWNQLLYSSRGSDAPLCVKAFFLP